MDSQQRCTSSPLHRHGDEIDAPGLVVVTDTTAKHRGLLLASEGLVLCEGFLVHGGGGVGWWVVGFVWVCSLLVGSLPVCSLPQQCCGIG